MEGAWRANHETGLCWRYEHVPFWASEEGVVVLVGCMSVGSASGSTLDRAGFVAEDWIPALCPIQKPCPMFRYGEPVMCRTFGGIAVSCVRLK